MKERLKEIGNDPSTVGRSGWFIANKKAAIFLDQWVQKNFRSEGGNVGGWLPLKRRRNRGRDSGGRFTANDKILQDTGRLRLSFLPFATPKDAGIGSQLPYSILHEKGLGFLPERRMLPKHPDVDEGLHRVYSLHIAGLTRRKL